VTPGVKELVRFGLGVTGFTVTDSVARSADRLALGYFYGAGPLGYFQNAFLLYSNLLNLLTEPLHNVAVSALSKIKDDLDHLKRSWATAVSAVSFASAAAFAVLAVTGQDFVVLLLGEKWAPAGPLLCIFAVRGIVNSVERTHGWLHVVAGRPDRWMRWGFVSSGCQLLALLAGISYGPIGVSIAYAVVMFGLVVPSLVYSGQPVGVGLGDVVSVVVPQTVSGLLAVAFGLSLSNYLMSDFWQVTRLIASGFATLIFYLALAVGVFRVTGPLMLAWSVVRDFGPLRSMRRFRPTEHT
jgi:PST family polysaccharide transporter